MEKKSTFQKSPKTPPPPLKNTKWKFRLKTRVCGRQRILALAADVKGLCLWDCLISGNYPALKNSPNLSIFFSK